jgi:hypothetical protein
LVTTAARAALRRARGAAATGVEGVNLQAHELVKPLANLVSNRNGREAKPFTGGDETTAAAETEAAALWSWARARVLASWGCEREGRERVRELK